MGTAALGRVRQRRRRAPSQLTTNPPPPPPPTPPPPASPPSTSRAGRGRATTPHSKRGRCGGETKCCGASAVQLGGARRGAGGRSGGGGGSPVRGWQPRSEWAGDAAARHRRAAAWARGMPRRVAEHAAVEGEREAGESRMCCGGRTTGSARRAPSRGLRRERGGPRRCSSWQQRAGRAWVDPRPQGMRAGPRQILTPGPDK